MRKLYSLLMGGALVVGAAVTASAQTAKTVPYESPIVVSSSALDDGWTAIASENGSWKYNTESGTTALGGSGYKAESQGNTKGTKDDWIISPLIHFDAGKNYRLFYYLWAERNDHPQTVNVYITGSDQPATIKGQTPDTTYTNFTETSLTTGKRDHKFTPSESGDYHVAFQCVSPSDLYYLRMAILQVYEDVFTPSGVTNFKAERDNSAPREVKVNLSWTLPTTSVFGDAFTADQTIEQINIYRDGESRPVKTFNSEATEWEDNVDQGLEPGIHTYEIEVVVAGAKSPKASATTKYVGPVQAASVPFTWTISNQDDFEDWATFVGDDAVNTNLWSYYSYGPYGRFSNLAGQKEENYLVAPPFKIETPGYYLVTVNSMISNTSLNADNTLKVVYGQQPNAESMTNVACEKIDFTSSSKTPYSYVVKIDNPGEYYFGVEAASEQPKATNFGVYSIGLEKTEKTPKAVTALKATPDPDEGLSLTLTWECPTQSSNDEELAPSEYKIEVYKGDAKIADLDGGVSRYVDSDIAEAGSFTYSVKTVAPEGASVGAVSVKSAWVGPHLVALPYTTKFAPADDTVAIWDIIDANEDGKTWVYYSNSYRCIESDEQGTDTDKRVYNDYFLTPHFDMEPGYYQLSFQLFGGSTGKPITMQVGAIEAGSFIPERPELMQQQQYEATSTSSSYAPVINYLFKVDTKGRYQFVFGMTGEQYAVTSSDISYGSPGITNVTVDAFPVLPGVATDLKAVPDEDGELEVVLTWTNPSTTNVDGVALDEITKAVIIRDGEEVATVEDYLLPGREASFTDDSSTQLTAGPHTYSVEIYNAAGKSQEAAPSVKINWVGGGLTAPITHGLNEFKEYWTFIDNDKNQSQYGDNGWWISGSAMKLDESNSNGSYDDWAVSPSIQIDANKTYDLEFKLFLGASYKSSAPYSVDLYVLNGGDINDRIKVGEVTATDETTIVSKLETVTLHIVGSNGVQFNGPATVDETADVTPVPAKTLNLALHGNKKGGINITNFSMTESETTGIDSVVDNDNDDDSDVEYYNLQGVKVKNPGPGIYIKVKGNKSTKIVK